MSLPSSQNGVFLNNSEKTKKHLENERRILRLQQVRNESRNIARKIRTDVAAEKQRQLIRLQATKEKELELWRRSVLLNKYEDYRSAVFHIGDAHAAAQAEREAKPKVAESLFRRQMRTRQSFNKYDPRAMNKKNMEKSKVIKNNDAFTQTVTSSSTQTANKENVNKADKSLHNNKRKWHTCQDTEDCLTSDESEELDSCCQASLCLKEKPELKQTGAVILEVKDTMIDGRKKQKPEEMVDNFVQTNRQFSHIVSNNNPTKKKVEKEVISSKPRFTQVSKVLEKAKANEDKTVANQDLRKTDVIYNNNHNDKENLKPRVQPTTSNKVNENLPMKYIEAYVQEPEGVQKRGTIRAPTKEYIKLTQEEIQQITEERNKACQDIKRLTEKLAGLSHDFCHEKFPKKIDCTKRQKPAKAATPPQTPKKVPERIDRALSAPTSPVARRKVDRASSPHPTELKTTESAASTAVETVDRSSSPLMIKTNEIDKASKPKTIRKNEESQVESSVDHKAPISSKKVHKTQKTQQISDTQQKRTNNIVLLDYAIDQSEMLTRDLKKELQSSNPAPNRVVELQSLLAKNESLRKQMSDIFERCRVLKFTEYDNKLLKSLISEMCKLTNEREMLFKETVLESQEPKEIKPLAETQPKPEKQPEKKEENKQMTHEENTKPVEIVITVKGATPLEGSVFNNQENLKLTLNAENKLEKVESSSAVKTPNEEDSVPKEISYDSESTHYKTLPKQIHSTVYDVSDEQTLVNIESHDEDTVNNTELPKAEAKPKSKPIIDPLVKQYVDRLLSMRRSFIRGLEISTSEVDTLSDSILNATSNRLQRSAEMNNSQSYFESAEQWITENYKFLENLEETLTKRQSVRLEKSIKITQDLPSKQTKPAAESKKLQENIDTVKKAKATTPTKTKKTEISNKILKEDNLVFKKPEKPAKTPTIQKTLATSPKSLKKTAENKNLSNNTKLKSLEKSQLSDDLNQQNTNNFSELAHSCSQRIDELNNMISRVREEKQRLVENTYSSLSIPSPEPATTTTATNIVEKTAEELTYIDTTELPDRRAALTGSRDSGIDNSRPATRQEAIPEEQKSAATTESSKHAKPPASLKRFSPQLNEEVAIHELSTIVEVETPITSRLTVATNEPQNKQVENTDLLKLQSDLEKELLDVLQGLRKRNNENNFAEFPSITTYLNKAEETSISLGEDANKAYEEKVKELINCLRLSNLSIKSFPTPLEYTRRLQQSPSVEMLHTASLDNISECVTEESDSDTMNIEEELRKRKLLLQPFQVEQQKNESNVSVTADLTGWAGSMIRRMQETNALSSGTSTSPHKMTKANKQRNKFKLDMHLLSSTVSGDDDSSSDSLGGRELNLRDFLHRELSRHCNSTSGSTSSPTGRLDISLGHQFINSILDSMTPKTQTSSNTGNSAPKNDTQNNLITHKTSTPVQSGKSRSQENDTSNSTTLFSCESHVSSVPLPNRKGSKNKK